MGFEGFEWGRIAATALLFVVPVLIFTFIVRKSLLRGLTFGAIKR
jgi:multiple sugar transport system permease protein